MWLAGERGWRVVNLDATVMLERPRLRPFVQEMREKLAQTLNAEAACVSVKAKTGEGLDAVGRGEAVTVQAVILLESVSKP
jgi:2-C-methyl-D-erythritol 2,4-cyclodiphosphate synthase